MPAVFSRARISRQRLFRRARNGQQPGDDVGDRGIEPQRRRIGRLLHQPLDDLLARARALRRVGDQSIRPSMAARDSASRQPAQRAQQALRVAGRALGHAVQQRLEIAGAPEMPLQPRRAIAPARPAHPPARRTAPDRRSCTEKSFRPAARSASTARDRISVSPAARSARPSSSAPAWKNWVGRLRLGRLMAEDQAVIADAGGKLARLLSTAWWQIGNGEIGAQAQFAARRIGQGEGAAADFLARTVEENVGGLQHRRLLAHIAARARKASRMASAWAFQRARCRALS